MPKEQRRHPHDPRHLNAEQELLTSQVNFVTARRDAYVADFTLLAAVTAQDLLDGGALYDRTSTTSA